MFASMYVELAVGDECCVTVLTGVGSLPSVVTLMSCMCTMLVESLGTIGTLVRFLTSMPSEMDLM